MFTRVVDCFEVMAVAPEPSTCESSGINWRRLAEKMRLVVERKVEMKKKSLRFKLIVGGVASVLIPLILVSVFSVNEATRALDKAGREQALHIARNVSEMVQVLLEEQMTFITELSSGDTLVAVATKVSKEGMARSTEEISKLDANLTRTMKQLGDEHEAVLVTDAQGNIYSDGNEGKYKGTSIADREYFKISKSGKANVGHPVKSKITGKPIYVVSAPIRSTAGEVVGVVATVNKIDLLADKINSIKVGETGYPWIVDGNGLLIVHPNSKHVLETNLAAQKGMESIMQKILSRQTGVDSYVFEGIPKIAGFTPVAMTGWGIGVTQNSDEFLVAPRAIRNMIGAVGLVSVILTLAWVLYFARSVNNPIKRAVELLNEASDQVAAASSQISSTGQSLAEGASEQAASIEETSSALEELTSMTRRNADHATEADNLMKEANQVIHRANESMEQLNTSMESISKTSEETRKIIKTIDEIAFQTNLLALNAAVEAARAGEAGAGFAVVADEVRNLAMRAAEAARNTSDLIEGSVKQIGRGTEIVLSTNEAFEEVARSSAKVGQLVAEIASASNEQAQGIGQINQAVCEMDKVVQQNAANAEESAAASEEMSAQAMQMKSVVKDLVVTIDGTARSQIVEEAPRPPEANRVRGKIPQRIHAPVLAQRAPAKPKALPTRRSESPEQVIPFDDGDMSDF